MDIGNVAVEMLLSITGVALVTAAIMGLLIKKPLRVKFDLVDGSEPEPKAKIMYSFYMNIAALTIALGFSFAGQLVMNGTTNEVILLAILNGLFAAISAVGLSEYSTNATRLIRKA